MVCNSYDGQKNIDFENDEDVVHEINNNRKHNNGDDDIHIGHG